jgi:glycosyltransferase involved in cell wall biosynthesis
MPAISVIVPTRLRHQLLARALRSLLAQTFQDFEILLIDDNPSEARVSAEAELAPLLADPKLRLLVDEQPRNAASARNLGLRAARGEWITYLDDDDAYQPTKLEKQWRRSIETRLPLGICGVTYHLAHRQRRRVVAATELYKSELLLLPFAMPTVFHRNAGNWFFDENLFAGEDGPYYYGLVERLEVERIFNVSESLVDVYPQPGPRVSANAEGFWQAVQVVYRDFAPAYGTVAAEVFLARARLGYLKNRKGGWYEMAQAACRLWRLRGWKEMRFIGNATLFKLPWMRRLLVS